MNFTVPIIPAPEFWTGDALVCLELVASNSVDCIVTFEINPDYVAMTRERVAAG